MTLVMLFTLTACMPADDKSSGPSPDNGNFVEPTKPPFEVVAKYVAESEDMPFEVEFSYADGLFYYYGTVTTPTPCHDVVVDTTVQESMPEVVTMNISTKDSGEICTQVLAQKKFSGSIQVSSQAVINVLLEGEPVSKVN